MGIQINEENLLFTLNTKRTTYQMHVDRYGYLLHQYYGRKTDGDMHFLLTLQDRGFSGLRYAHRHLPIERLRTASVRIHDPQRGSYNII